MTYKLYLLLCTFIYSTVFIFQKCFVPRPWHYSHHIE